MAKLKILVVAIASQVLLALLQWWAAASESPLAYVFLGVSVFVLPIVCGWRLGRIGTPVGLSSASGVTLTMTWIITGYVARWLTGEPDEETWRNVVSTAFWWLITLQVAFAYVGGSRGLRSASRAA